MILWLLLDTNAVARLLQPNEPSYPRIAAALQTHMAAGFVPCVVPQVLYELWVILTRPTGAANGFGQSAAEAEVTLANVRAQFNVLDDTPDILPAWLPLVTTHAVLGKKAHDARFVAAMQVHGVSHLLTFNAADFQRFSGITVVTP